MAAANQVHVRLCSLLLEIIGIVVSLVAGVAVHLWRLNRWYKKVRITVTAVKESNTTKQECAHYGLSQAGRYLNCVTGACDANLDGVVQAVGIPPSMHLLAQTVPPPRLPRPECRMITAGTTSTPVTFEREMPWRQFAHTSLEGGSFALSARKTVTQNAHQ